MASCSSDSIPYSLRRRRTAGIDHSGRVSPATQKIRGGRDGGSMHIPHAVDGLAMCVYEETVIGTVFSPAPGPSLPRDCLDVPFQTCVSLQQHFRERSLKTTLTSARPRRNMRLYGSAVIVHILPYRTRPRLVRPAAMVGAQIASPLKFN